MEPSFPPVPPNTLSTDQISTTTTRRRSVIRPEDVSDQQRIPVAQARNSLRVTTQRGVQTVLHPTVYC